MQDERVVLEGADLGFADAEHTYLLVLLALETWQFEGDLSGAIANAERAWAKAERAIAIKDALLTRRVRAELSVHRARAHRARRRLERRTRALSRRAGLRRAVPLGIALERLLRGPRAPDRGALWWRCAAVASSMLVWVGGCGNELCVLVPLPLAIPGPLAVWALLLLGTRWLPSGVRAISVGVGGSGMVVALACNQVLPVTWNAMWPIAWNLWWATTIPLALSFAAGAVRFARLHKWDDEPYPFESDLHARMEPRTV